MVENPPTLLSKLVRIVDYNGTPKNRVARVVEVRDSMVKPFEWSSFRKYLKNKTQGSQYLLTVLDVDTGEYRSYYHKGLTLEVIDE